MIITRMMLHHYQAEIIFISQGKLSKVDQVLFLLAPKMIHIYI